MLKTEIENYKTKLLRIFKKTKGSSIAGHPPGWPKTNQDYEEFWHNQEALKCYFEPSRLTFYEEILEFLPKKRGKVLDVGCGNGYFLTRLAKEIGNLGQGIIGIDCVSSGFTEAKKKLPKAKFLQTNAEEMPFANDSFDLVLMMETLEHLKSWQQALAQSWRVVKPGGILLLTIPDGAMDFWTGHTNFWTEDEFLKILSKFGSPTVVRVDNNRTLVGILTKLKSTPLTQEIISNSTIAQYLINSRFSFISYLGESLRILKRNYLNLRNELEYLYLHKKAVKEAKTLLKQRTDYLKIELGCGEDFQKNGWVGIDLYCPNQLTIDLRKAFPFPDESVKEIHAEHLLEHFNYQQLQHILKECYRILIPNGTARFSVPNSEKAIKLYATNQKNFFQKMFWCKPEPNWLKTPMDALNWLFYMDTQHHFMFDKQNALSLLREVGFRIVSTCKFDPKIDRADRSTQSLYFRGTK